MFRKKSSSGARWFSAGSLGSSTASDVSVATALGAPAATARYGVDGSGVKIGVISDSFDALGTEGTDVATGALPAASDIQVVADSSSGRDEGRAMAEIAYDVAPGSEIVFAPAGGSVAALGAAIASLQAAGCQIICDDVTYANEPFYQMGDAAENAISSFTAAGGTYFTAASNAGPKSAYEAGWSGMQTTLAGVGIVQAMNFGTAAAPRATEALKLQAGQQTVIDLQWAQPWASIDPSGAGYSLGLAIYDPSGTLVKTAAVNAVGGDPVQWAGFVPATSGNYTVAVYANGGNVPEGALFKIVANNDSSCAATFADAQGSGSVFGHNADPDAITVGAVCASKTPAYGGTPASERFSSAGPGALLFSNTGVPIANPTAQHAVDISGPDGQATTLPASDLNPFYGTSAATPAVAAVAALMKQANPLLDAGEIKAELQASALPFGTTDQAGAGLAQAQGAVALAVESNSAIHDDLFGTGQSAIVWQKAGSARASQVSSDAAVQTTALAAPAGPGWGVVGSGDFSHAPGQADLLWQNDDGRLALGHVQGGLETAPTLLSADPGRAWEVVGTGDFNGDGQSDILMKNASGAAELWLMDGGKVAQQATYAGMGAGWSIVAAGDLDNDGQTDLVWQNSSGALAVWMMNGTSVASELTLPGNPGSDWHVVGTGDFNADGHADILLQNRTSGALDIWAMNGNSVLSSTAVTTNLGAGWTAEGVGQFGPRGHDGVLFGNAATGAAEIAELRHGQIKSVSPVAGPGAGWSATIG